MAVVPFGNFGWNFGFGFGWIIVIVTCILIMLGILQLVRMGSGERRKRQRETALDALEKQYARREISREEFEARKEELQRAKRT